MSIYVRYDPEADAIYAELMPRAPGDVARTSELGGGRQVDFNAAGEVLGVEFLDVSAGIDLVDVPRADEIREALARLSLLSVA
jgi:uncharacterized protein YuzE